LSAKLTRKALYDLVWSKPRTTLAREMGVSDVWIGKQCRALNVPAPPPGYWANRAAGGKPKAKYLRPPLSYTVAERMQEEHDDAAAGLEGFDVEDLQRDLPPAPVFVGTTEEAVARYTSLVRAQAVRRRAVGHHPVVQRLLAEDERRAIEASPYAWQQPLYRSRQGQAILQAVDKIAWHWTNAGLRVAASGGHIILSVSGAGQSSGFELRAAPAPKREGQRGRPPSRTTLEFWLDPDRDARRKADKPALVFDTMDAATVDALTALVITSWERRVREWFRWRHHHIVESRERAVRAVEEAARRERERREAEVRALHDRRQRLLLRAIDRARRAQEIRAFVADLAASPATGEVDEEALARWKAWALGQADALDLRVQPPAVLADWVRGFELGDAKPD
jgi:hypothetical protein